MGDICTPLGNPVVTYLMCESSTSTRAGLDATYAQTYPNAEQIPTYDGYSATRKFNCHGYAWLRVEQGIDRWIGYNYTTDEDIYMTDGSYTQVSQATYPGKVSWASGDHSAVTTNQQGIFISKWNEYPLMRHAWNYSPYGTTNLKYYVRSADVSISGPSHACTAGTVFSLENLPSGATVQWSVSGTAFTLSNQTNTSVRVTKTGLDESQAVLTALINTCASVTKTITPCPLRPYSPSFALCTSDVFSIANLPSGISGSQVSWSCSSNLALVGGNTGLSKTVNVLSVGDGTGWVEVNVNQQLVKRSYVTILMPSSYAYINGSNTITQYSAANYTLFSLTDPIETYIPDSESELEFCGNVTWTSSSNLSISPGMLGSSNPGEEIEHIIPISVYATGTGSGWIRAQITVNGSTLYVQKNIQISQAPPPSMSVSITNNNYYFHAVTSPQANSYIWRFNSNIVGSNSADLYYLRENNNLSIVNTVHVAASNGSLSAESQITVYGEIIVEEVEEEYLAYYPNPVTSGTLTIAIDMTKYGKSRAYLQAIAGNKSKTPAFSAKLCNTLGVPLRQATLTGGNAQLNVSGLTPGLYFLLVYDGLNAKPTMHRVVVN
ncbi:MAG: T9SS type A sorting domain-containing protein [Candidatus Symbiothrix sp.]|nr:T9SS type A sorting domain-containing protein [Candidatus Symbiothrix sp.]